MVRSAATAILLAAALAGCGAAHKAEEAPEAARPVVVTVAEPPTRREISDLFDLWNDTLRTGSARDIALLYADDAVLTPFDLNDQRTNRQDIADYFVHFLDFHPRATLNQRRVSILRTDMALDDGVATFDLVKTRNASFVVVRFSTVYVKVGGKWLIQSQHWSLAPEPIVSRPPSLAERLSDAPPEADAAPKQETDAPPKHEH